jgi:hypothetical protein
VGEHSYSEQQTRYTARSDTLTVIAKLHKVHTVYITLEEGSIHESRQKKSTCMGMRNEINRTRLTAKKKAGALSLFSRETTVILYVLYCYYSYGETYFVPADSLVVSCSAKATDLEHNGHSYSPENKWSEMKCLRSIALCTPLGSEIITITLLC